jgi:hypothetical protein
LGFALVAAAAAAAAVAAAAVAAATVAAALVDGRRKTACRYHVVSQAATNTIPPRLTTLATRLGAVTQKFTTQILDPLKIQQEVLVPLYIQQTTPKSKKSFFTHKKYNVPTKTTQYFQNTYQHTIFSFLTSQPY